jgi:hypothetical protein
MSLEKTLQTFGEKIDFVRRGSLGVPKTFDIDLSIAIVDQEYAIAGNIMYIVHAPDDTVYVDVKFNANRESTHRLYRAMGFETPFDRMFITTPAGQTGTITVVYATEAPELMRVIDNRSSTSLGMNQLVAELQGDATPENWGEVTVGAAAVQLLAANTNRKACWIDSDPNNTGIVYLGFDNTVTTAAGGNIWFKALMANGGWGVDDYRGAIFGIATAAGQLIGTGEW